MGQETRGEGEHSLYTGGGGATEAQVRGGGLIRQVKEAEQSPLTGNRKYHSNLQGNIII